MEIDVGFKTTAGGNLTSRNDDVGRMTSFANNLAHTLFKQINVKCNGMLLTEQVDMYHHKAYLQTLLNNDRNDGDTILQATNGGWRNEIDSPVTYTATNVKGDDQQASIKAQPTESVRMHADDVKLSLYRCLVKLNPSTYMDMMGL